MDHAAPSCAGRLRRKRRPETAGWASGWCASRAVSEQLVTRALGLQWSCPVLGLELHDAERLTALLPRLFVDAFGALPLRVAAGKILYLGFEARLDPVLALAVERMTGLRVESGLVQESLFRAGPYAHAECEVSRRGTDRGSLGAGACAGAHQADGTGSTDGVPPGAGARLSVAEDVDAPPERTVTRGQFCAGPDLFPPSTLRFESDLVPEGAFQGLAGNADREFSRGAWA